MGSAEDLEFRSISTNLYLDNLNLLRHTSDIEDGQDQGGFGSRRRNRRPSDRLTVLGQGEGAIFLFVDGRASRRCHLRG